MLQTIFCKIKLARKKHLICVMAIILATEKNIGANLAKTLTHEQSKWYKLYDPIQWHKYSQDLAFIFSIDT